MRGRARTPIGASGNLKSYILKCVYEYKQPIGTEEKGKVTEQNTGHDLGGGGQGEGVEVAGGKRM
jgi:hypothetical protein